MAIATKPKPSAKHHKKRTAAHHRQSKVYVKSYLPYLPMLAVVASGFVANNLLHSPAILGTKTEYTSSQLLLETNAARQHSQVSGLSLDAKLSQAAQAKAEDMARNNYWSHATPTGQDPWSFITATGYQYQAAGENLGYGFVSSSGLTKAWMHSQEHRKNLLSANFTQVGFGITHANNYLGNGPQTITVALYGRPLTAAAAAPITSLPQSSVVVSRTNTVLGSTAAGFVVGAIGAAAFMFVLLRHGISWRRYISRGELFVIQHPTLDIALIGVATIAVVLSQTVGFIR